MPLSAEQESRMDRIAGVISRLLRPVILLSLTGVVVYMAIAQDSKDAQVAILAQFATLAGATWGERSALKAPGEFPQQREEPRSQAGGA